MNSSQPLVTTYLEIQSPRYDDALASYYERLRFTCCERQMAFGERYKSFPYR
jgi:hypothetical protein